MKMINLYVGDKVYVANGGEEDAGVVMSVGLDPDDYDVEVKLAGGERIIVDVDLLSLAN